MIRLKHTVNITELSKFGFTKDPVNCDDKEDHYYHLNNYYCQVNENFRITANMHSGQIDILCLVKEPALYNMYNLKPLYELFTSELVEMN